MIAHLDTHVALWLGQVETGTPGKEVKRILNRLLVAQARRNDSVLITKDRSMRRHFDQAIW